jgi:hypothetical protein
MTGTGKLTLPDGTVYHLKNWRQVFPGVRGKQLKKKRRASKDSDALIAQFKQLAEETLRAPAAKIPRAAMRASAVEETIKLPDAKMQRGLAVVEAEE